MIRKYGIAVVLSILPLLSHAENSESDTLACFSGTNNCAAIVDAGSSGSRLHLFSYDLDENNYPIHVHEVWTAKKEPGLSTILKREDVIKDYLNDLFKSVPLSPKANKKVPVYFYGTAGMRLIPKETQKFYYKTITTHFTDTHYWNPLDTRTISGNEEGIFGWLSINYQLGLLDESSSKPFASYMDMGGASVQVVTPVDKASVPSDSMNYAKLHIYGKDINLFVHSFLGLGQNQVQNQFLQNKKCYANGYSMVNNELASGNAEQCVESVEHLINQVHEVDAIVQPVLKENPPGQWYTTGGAAYTANYKLFDLPKNQFTSESLLNAVDFGVCRANWEHLEALDPSNTYLPYYCLVGSYYYALMVKGYGIDPGEAIHIPEKGADWSMGVLLAKAPI